MQELVYLLKVPPELAETARDRLSMAQPPTFVRLATIAPLSNYGYDEQATAHVMSLNPAGVVFGDPTRPEVPRAFVPWSNVAYVADGSELAARQAEVAATEKPGAQPIRMSRGRPR